MKKALVLLGAVLFVSGALYAQNAASAAAAAPVEKTEAQKKEDEQKMLYSLGFMMGENIKKNLIVKDETEYKAISQGMLDSLQNKKAQVNPDDYKDMIVARYKADGDVLAKKQKETQDAFLAQKKKEKGSKTIDDGIIVQSITKGKGKYPSSDSTVKVHYHGTLIDGTVFDSSVERGEPIEFSLGQVISCWRKGMQEVRVGGKARLICPADTAYGNRQAGLIPPNSLLVFDVELLEIK